MRIKLFGLDAAKPFGHRVARALLPGLWFLFGKLLYKLATGARPPTWHNLPGYLATLTGFLLGYATVGWWRERQLHGSDKEA